MTKKTVFVIELGLVLMGLCFYLNEEMALLQKETIQLAFDACQRGGGNGDCVREFNADAIKFNKNWSFFFWIDKIPNK